MEICCERWEVTPLAPPRLVRHCPGCNATRPFACAGTFRVNAQKKTLDAWLNYRCERCDSAWKCPIIERRPVRRIDPLLLEALFRDDPLVARRLAFDLPLLRKQNVPIDANSDVTVRRVAIAPAADDVAPLCIRLAVPYAVHDTTRSPARAATGAFARSTTKPAGARRTHRVAGARSSIACGDPRRTTHLDRCTAVG